MSEKDYNFSEWVGKTRGFRYNGFSIGEGVVHVSSGELTSQLSKYKFVRFQIDKAKNAVFIIGSNTQDQDGFYEVHKYKKCLRIFTSLHKDMPKGRYYVNDVVGQNGFVCVRKKMDNKDGALKGESHEEAPESRINTKRPTSFHGKREEDDQDVA